MTGSGEQWDSEESLMKVVVGLAKDWFYCLLKVQVSEASFKKGNDITRFMF